MGRAPALNSHPVSALTQPADLERLFQEAADDLARYFSRRHGGGAELSQDLVQETFLEMAKGMEQGRRPRSPRGYLFGIARHVSQAAWQRHYRERELVSEQAAETVPIAAPDERLAAARETIEALPPLHREILELRFSQQLSYAEIAEALAIPLGTVRSRLHHAIVAVRDRLQDEPA